MPVSRRERSAGRGAGTLMGRGLLLLIFGASVYSLSLLATVPARMAERYAEIPPQVEALGGTIWNGSALIAGGHRLEWRLDRQGSLTALAPRFDLSLEGPGTRLTAQGEVSPDRSGGTLTDVNGRASWPLAAAFATDAPPLACDSVASIDLARIVVQRNRIGAAGTMRSNAGSCIQLDDPDSAPIPTPPLLARAAMDGDTSRAVLTSGDAPDTVLAEATLADARQLALMVYPAGARLVPGLPTSGPMSLEMELPPLTGRPRPDR